MTKLEKVIKALECCKDINKLDCDNCPYTYNARSDRHECTAEMAFDARELLKEREPRVIDIGEIYTAKKIDVWLDDKSENFAFPLMLIDAEMTNKSQTAFFYPMMVRPIKAYGKTWRCWTARPTDEQRKAVKWDGAY